MPSRYAAEELGAYRYINAPRSAGQRPRGLGAEVPALQAIAALGSELAAQGIELVVVPIPLRIAIDPFTRAGVSVLAPGELEFCARLFDRGLSVLDLYSGLSWKDRASPLL